MRLLPQLLVAATFAILSAAPALAQGLYPTAIGSRWELADSSGATLVRTIASSRVATDGKTVFSIRDKLADGRYRTRWLREEMSAFVFDDRGRQVMKIQGTVGLEFTSPVTELGFGFGDGRRMRIAGRARTVSTRVARYTNCIEVAYPDSPVAAREWFAPGIGLVKRLEWTPVRGSRVFTLRAVRIGRPPAATDVDRAKAALVDHIESVLFSATLPADDPFQEVLSWRDAASKAQLKAQMLAEARALTPGTAEGQWELLRTAAGNPVYCGRLGGLYTEVEVPASGACRVYVEID